MDKFTLPFPVIFIGLWLILCLLISMMSGWWQLAKQFSANNPPSGKRFILQSGKIGLARYNGCLFIYKSPEGLYISVLFPFRLGHPPLFIPWQAINNVKTQHLAWGDSLIFDIGLPCITTMQLPKKIFEGSGINETIVT